MEDNDMDGNGELDEAEFVPFFSAIVLAPFFTGKDGQEADAVKEGYLERVPRPFRRNLR